MLHSLIDHTLGNKISLNKFKWIEIISSIFSDHNGMKLEINHTKKNWKQNYITKQHATKNNNNDKYNNGSMMK